MILQANTSISLQTKIGDNDTTELVDILACEDAFEDTVDQRLCREKVESVLTRSKLNAREVDILRLRHGFEGEAQTLEDVGTKYNLTRERIRQLEAKALSKLRGDMQIRHLRDLLS